ncbi:transposable element Tc3 transposase [Trichonephila clavipes]|uniref:Transposable element Tc3 transposase n=1 Tax=Trichonephila clavipes TaxID=2585209 RepID=A0A8X6W035_TRICX|nr:transposable element Tc3 transposase [Trichonephila clavipes]
MGHMEEVGEDEDSAIVYYLLIMVSTAKKAKQLLYVYAHRCRFKGTNFKTGPIPPEGNFQKMPREGVFIILLYTGVKIKDEVEKLAYQLNEEAERTKKTNQEINSLNPTELLPQREMANNQSVRRHLDAFTRGRIIGKLEEGCSVTRTAIRGSVVVVHEEPHPQMTGTLSYRPDETGGRQREKSLDTRHRQLDDRYRVLPWPEDCTVVVCLHDALYDESRFSLSSDSHRILIWRERGSRNHPSNIIERNRYGGRGVLVWGGIMLGSRTDLHIFDAGSVNGTRYCNEILLPYVRPFRGAMGLQFLFMDDNAPCHRTVAAEQLLESEDIERMDWPARSPDLNTIEHVWDLLGRRLAARTLPPVTIRELRLALQDEWAAMPQQLIDTLILSMGR